jgi:hypothetical protein
MMYQMIALNVAVNSYDHALLTLLVSNQFVEIKGSVFKKFEKVRYQPAFLFMTHRDSCRTTSFRSCVPVSVMPPCLQVRWPDRFVQTSLNAFLWLSCCQSWPFAT